MTTYSLVYCTPFSIWNECLFPCSVLTVGSWLASRFLKRQVRWSGSPISLRIFQFVVIHIVKGFGIVNKAGVDVFLELSHFSCDPADVGNLISGSSAFCKFSLYIWKFLVHVLLKPSLKDLEHYKVLIKTTIRYHHTPARMVKIKYSNNTKCWWEGREIGSLIPCWSEYKTI